MFGKIKNRNDFLRNIRSIYLFVLVFFIIIKRAKMSTEEMDARDEKTVGRYQVAKFNFVEVSEVYAITLWILLGSLAKIGNSNLSTFFRRSSYINKMNLQKKITFK